MSKQVSKIIYPQDISEIKRLPEGQVISIAGWMLSKIGTYVYFLYDPLGASIRISTHPGLEALIPDPTGGSTVIPQCYFTIFHTMDMWSPTWPPDKTTDLHWYIPTNNPCDCGAIHTSFSSHHSDWCNFYNLK